MVFFFSSRRRHTRLVRDWSSDVCSSDLDEAALLVLAYNLKFSKQPDKAIEAFGKILKLSPENEAATLFLDALKSPGKADAKADAKGASPEAGKKLPTGAT